MVFSCYFFLVSFNLEEFSSLYLSSNLSNLSNLSSLSFLIMAFFFFWVQASFAKCPSIYIILFLHNESQVYVLFTFQSGVLYEWWFVPRAWHCKAPDVSLFHYWSCYVWSFSLFIITRFTLRFACYTLLVLNVS